jgi:hypothetical protein
MKYSTVEDVMASFPHQVLPTVQGEPDYQTIHANRKFLQANLLAINTHLGGGNIGTLGPNHLICFLRHYCPNNERGTTALGNTIIPREGTSHDGWSSGSNQRRSPPLGIGCSDLPKMHLRPTGIEEENHLSV